MAHITVQIYGVTDVATALEVARLGADHIGFIAGRYGLVACEVDFETARAIAEALPPSAKAVALTMATRVDEILDMVATVGPDILHISTDPLDVGPAAIAELRRRLPPDVLLMKAIPVTRVDETLQLVRTFEPWTDIFLLDTKVEGLPGVGATGQTHDWEVSRRVVEVVRKPVILAGGLTPENVVEAVRFVRPWGVDSFSGTNVPGTSVKDLARVQAFVTAVRAVEAELN
jgi:phosphoribosylanthranilate isomerase